MPTERIQTPDRRGAPRLRLGIVAGHRRLAKHLRGQRRLGEAEARGGAAEAPEGFAAVTHDGWIVTDDQGRTVMVEAAA